MSALSQTGFRIVITRVRESAKASSIWSAPRHMPQQLSQLVFVYGTLKRGYALHALLQGQLCHGSAVTEPLYRMFDLGSYPGLVEWPEGLAIRGEVYQVDVECLSRLDEVEGVAEKQYVRRRISLKGEFESSDVHAWFWLNDVQGLRDCGSEWT